MGNEIFSRMLRAFNSVRFRFIWRRPSLSNSLYGLRTSVRWRHNQIFWVWWITNFSYPSCFTGPLKLRFEIGTSVKTTKNQWKCHLKTNIYTLENVFRLAHLFRFPESLRSTLQLECKERHLSKYEELKIPIHMLELRANRKFGDFTLLKFFRFGKVRAARAARLFSSFDQSNS